MDSHKYHRQVVKITEEFLGPAAERFVNRQIEFRLGKTPDTLVGSDIPKLKEALGTALAILTKDQEIVAEVKHKFDVITKE